MRDIRMEALMAAIHVGTQPGMRNHLATEILPAPADELLQKGPIWLCAEEGFSRCAEEAILIAPIPEVPTKTVRACPIRISISDLKFFPERLRIAAEIRRDFMRSGTCRSKAK
jgi:hypothetical protein